MKYVGTILIAVLAVSTAPAKIQRIGTIGRGALERACFIPNGRILAVLKDRIEIQDADTGGAIACFAKRTQGIGMGKVAISQDGDLVAIATYDSGLQSAAIEIWDIETGRQIRHWDASDRIRYYMREIAFSPNAPILAVVTHASVHLWNWKTQEYLGILESDQPVDLSTWRQRYISVAFSSDGNRMLVDRANLPVAVWDLASRKLLAPLKLSFGGYGLVAYSPNGKWIAASRVGGKHVGIWDARTFEHVRSWWHELKFVRQIFFDPLDSKKLYAVSEGLFRICSNNICTGENARLRVFDIEHGSLIAEFGNHLTRLQHASFSADGNQVILGYNVGVGAYALWDVEEQRQIELRADYSSLLARTLITADNRFLLSVNDFAVKVWDLHSGSLRHAIFPTKSKIQWGAISPDGQMFVIGHGDNYEVRSISTGEVISEISTRFGADSPVTFSSDNQRIAYYAGVAVIARIDRPRILKYFELNPPWLDFAADSMAIAISADDNYLAAADLDGTIHLWKRNWQNQYVYRYSWDAGVRPNRFAFSPSSASEAPLLAVSGNETQVWRIESVTPREITPSGLKDTTFVQFSGDGRFIFVNKGEHLKTFDWHRDELLDFPQPIPRAWAISADGSTLITVEKKNYLSHLWAGQLFPGLGRVQATGKENAIFGELKRDALLQNFPNPFNPETWIPYQLANPATVMLTIYDMRGHAVRTLAVGYRPPGVYRSRERAAYWDGRNEMGETVANGVYFYRLAAGDFSAARKMVVGK